MKYLLVIIFKLAYISPTMIYYESFDKNPYSINILILTLEVLIDYSYIY